MHLIKKSDIEIPIFQFATHFSLLAPPCLNPKPQRAPHLRFWNAGLRTTTLLGGGRYSRSSLVIRRSSALEAAGSCFTGAAPGSVLTAIPGSVLIWGGAAE